MFAAFINIIIRSSIVILFSRDGLDRCLGFDIKYVIIAFLKELLLFSMPYTLLNQYLK